MSPGYPAPPGRAATWEGRPVIGILRRLIKGLSGNRPVDYDQAKALARHADPKVRVDLAARTDVKPEILYFLADDSSPDVRRAIAANTAAPRPADLLLARDADAHVRAGLAEKIARLAPGLTADEQDKVRRMTYEALDILARDQVPRVRQILSETLKDVADAPPEVIHRLARDAELIVCGPVLEYSPVLTDDDLQEIIASAPVQGALGAISRRAGVGETVADAIVASDDLEAVAELLANPSAQIREETLDTIVDRAVDMEAWHAPLVRRPVLPPGVARRLARFVADHLLETLAGREDLDPTSVEAVRTEVRQRLDEGYSVAAATGQEAQGTNTETAPPTHSLEMVQDLHRSGKLDEATVANALHSGDHGFVIAALAVRGGLAADLVEKVVRIQSIKGVVALAWKAGLSMDLAEQLQQKLAGIAPGQVLKATGGANYPLSEDEMKWQLEFLGDL